MKTIFTILLLVFMGCSLRAQQHCKKINYLRNNEYIDAYIPATILVVTFTSLELKGRSMTYGQRSVLAMGGIAASVVCFLITDKILKTKFRPQNRGITFYF